MLPELILYEEEETNLPILFVAGLLSGILGFLFANQFFPSQREILAPVFASIPLIYPLMAYYLEHEEHPDFVNETTVYASMFAGQATAFMMIALALPDSFALQMEIIGLSGHAVASEVTFASVFTNNMMVFGAILLAAFFLGSSGAFILSWNASVLGVFFAYLIRDLSGLEIIYSNASPLAYVPHASLEMTGFMIAGILGTTASASVYRKHWGLEHWKQLGLLGVVGFVAILTGAIIETF